MEGRPFSPRNPYRPRTPSAPLFPHYRRLEPSAPEARTVPVVDGSLRTSPGGLGVPRHVQSRCLPRLAPTPRMDRHKVVDQILPEVVDRDEVLEVPGLGRPLEKEGPLREWVPVRVLGTQTR